MNSTKSESLVRRVRLSTKKTAGYCAVVVVCCLLVARRLEHDQDSGSREVRRIGHREQELSGNWELEMTKRKETVEEVCRNFRSVLRFKTNHRHILYHKKAHLAYCLQPKVASTTFIKIFFHLSNITFNLKDFPHHKSFTIFAPPTNLANFRNSSIAVYFVRHPFTRLISAYKDRIQGPNFFPHLKELIINTYRNTTNNFDKWKHLSKLIGSNVTSTPTAVEFIRYVLYEIESCFSRPDKGSCYKEINPHWAPFYLRCNPCSMPFDIFGKLETIKSDLQYTIAKLSKFFEKIKNEKAKQPKFFTKLQETEGDVLSILRKAVEIHENKVSKELSTPELTRRVWGLLTEEEKRRIREAFYFDFLLFGYDPFEFDQTDKFT